MAIVVVVTINKMVANESNWIWTINMVAVMAVNKIAPLVWLERHRSTICMVLIQKERLDWNNGYASLAGSWNKYDPF